MAAEIFKTLLRSDFHSFMEQAFMYLNPDILFHPNWHLEAIAWHLQQCVEGEIKRLIITMPPRSLKSHCASVSFPAWILGKDPGKKIICVSYSNDLSSKFSRESRKILESTWFQECFPGARLNPKKCTEQEVETRRHGYRFSTSLGGTLTGRGGNVIIIDDPLKPDDAESETRRKACNEWFDGTLLTRLDNKREDIIILVMQRVHTDDLVGHVLKNSSSWVHLDLPAIAQEDQYIPIGVDDHYMRATHEPLHMAREPIEILESIQKQMGTRRFNTQYLQRPVPAEGNLIRWKWFQHYSSSISCESGLIVQSWDTASKAEELNDYSVCTSWLMKNNAYYLLNVYRARLEYPQLRKKVIELKKQYAAYAVLIEDKGSGTQLIQDLKYGYGIYAIKIHPEQDKVTRLSTQSAVIEAGQVYLPKEADWLEHFKAEMLAFPLGKFDDQVDSLSQFLMWAEKQNRGRVRSSILCGSY